MQKSAVIDLGTNTFHLLIVAPSESDTFLELCRERIFVKLAEEGIERIGAAPFERGLAAMRRFKTILDEQEVKQLKAFGTAALRTASNAGLFIQRIKEETNIEVAIIDGDEEALLIYQGVRQVVNFGVEKGLIMDIGGGSVEFILANQNGVIWAQSFPIGVAVLTRKFHQEDPISETAITALHHFLDNILQPLHEILRQHNVDNLIGASGTFDVLEATLVKPTKKVLSSSFPTHHFAPLYKRLIHTSLEERFQMSDIPDSRAELIITALILIQYIIDLTKTPEIIVSSYALKEGAIAQFNR
ncbi:MAG: exopolyphosphatase/guanosine-5'-triphosphate,3'-diphosphate pyrophosphatase [Polaribacter sp.]|jgi:exopolyphosphatase/guanosine-5'-triphosphate,3'-diphosphate pyrophosphatase